MIDLDLKNKILKTSVYLYGYGINGFAWNKKDALIMIESILNDEIGILGGDVFVFTDELKSTYNNWHSDPKSGESINDFYRRSKLESLLYITNFREEDENILFSIVFTESLE